jgi:cytochrome c553
MPSSPKPPAAPPAWAAFALLLTAACAPERSRDPFTATGEVIALSGGDAGATRACFTCHGMRGEGDGHSTPRLAGLPSGYMQRQLIDYADGRRADKVMGPIAKALDADDRRAVSDYYAALSVPPKLTPAMAAPQPAAAALYHEGDPDRGLPSCASCHGAAGEGIGPANPPLFAQPPAYLAEQMRRWRTSERRNDPLNVMLTISRRLTTAEIEALARYASGLGPAAVPASEFPAASR